MRYKFKSGDVICYSIPAIGPKLDQFLWFVKWGDPQYNFYKINAVYVNSSYSYWKLQVAKSKVVLGLYK